MIERIFENIVMNGGTPFLVGGSVRDELLKVENKDIDVEVFSMDIETLIAILSEFGDVNQVGKSFGVLKLRTLDGQEFDFSLPRTESKIGKGHKGFMVKPDKDLSPQEAAKRRDFTINSMSKNIMGEIFDWFGGMKDLEERILRHTSEFFADDPLRVMRGFQFAGRFDMNMHPDTVELSESLKDEFDDLAPERIWIEFEKWASKSVKPSKGIDVLVQTRWIENFPELHALEDCEQEPEWHPEGTVLIHSALACDKAVQICEREGLDQTIHVLAALLHDIGKPATTFVNDAGRIVSPKHASVGSPIAEEFLEKMKAPKNLIAKVSFLVKHHMWLQSIQKMTPAIVARMVRKLQEVDLTMKDLTVIIESDHSARPPLEGGLPEMMTEALELAEQMNDKVEPIVMGRHLIEIISELELDVKPGPVFGDILDQLEEAQIEGVFDDLDGGLVLARKILRNA